MSDSETAVFEEHRAFLTGLAYRMLGSVADAEDVLQDAFLRWRRASPETVEHPRAFLSKVVSRLCLDKLKEARRRREIYVGPWLPEPIVNDPALSAPAPETVAEDISFALMLALERLSPLERAAFKATLLLGAALYSFASAPSPKEEKEECKEWRREEPDQSSCWRETGERSFLFELDPELVERCLP